MPTTVTLMAWETLPSDLKLKYGIAVFTVVLSESVHKYPDLNAETAVEDFILSKRFSDIVGLDETCAYDITLLLVKGGVYWFTARYSGQDPWIDVIDKPLGYDEWMTSRGIK